MRKWTLLAVAFMGLQSFGCGTTSSPMANPTSEPVIDQPGRHLVRYRDRVIEILVESGFAANNPGEEWLILNLGMSGMTAEATAVDRSRITVRSPDGTRIPLPSYREFNRAFVELATLERRASLASQPLDFTRGGRRPCFIDFMPRPGSGRAAKTVLHVTKNQICTGLLYFPVPGGVRLGPWRLIVEFEESRAVVPFTLTLD